MVTRLNIDGAFRVPRLVIRLCMSKNGIEKLEVTAEKGIVEDQVKLADLYFNGAGVKKDYKKAAYWAGKAAERGQPAAQNKLGYLFFHGLGVEKDYFEAIKWYVRAARQNNDKAQANIGNIYANGIGLEKDLVEAYAWYNLACASSEAWIQSKKARPLKLRVGNPTKADFPFEARDSIESQLVRPEIIKAHRRTRELKKSLSSAIPLNLPFKIDF